MGCTELNFWCPERPHPHKSSLFGVPKVSPKCPGPCTKCPGQQKGGRSPLFSFPVLVFDGQDEPVEIPSGLVQVLQPILPVPTPHIADDVARIYRGHTPQVCHRRFDCVYALDPPLIVRWLLHHRVRRLPVRPVHISHHFTLLPHHHRHPRHRMKSGCRRSHWLYPRSSPRSPSCPHPR